MRPWTTTASVRALATALVAALTAAAVVVAPAGGTEPASATTPRRYVSGWVPVWSSAAATDGLEMFATTGNDQVFVDVSPFAYSAESATELVVSGAASTLASTVTAIRRRGLPVLPSITDGTARLEMAAILADPLTRAQHVDAIVDLVLTNGYDGIDLDYEGFAFTDGQASWPTTRPNWAAFVAELGAELHAADTLLSVTVPPIWDGGSRGYTVYAWPEMLPHIDRLRLMVYDWSFSAPGPIAPMTWVDDVIATVRQLVPAEQWPIVYLGVPTYGRNWPRIAAGECPADADLRTYSVQMEDAAGLAARRGATPVRHSSGEMTFTYDLTYTGPRVGSPAPPSYDPPAQTVGAVGGAADAQGLRPALRLNAMSSTVTCTVRRTVFVPDEQSVLQRATAALDGGLGGIAVWAFGYETDALWTGLVRLGAERGT